MNKIWIKLKNSIYLPVLEAASMAVNCSATNVVQE